MPTLLSLHNVSYRYASEPVLENINLDIEQGSYIGILGPNGGGKTTLIKLLLGILTPTSGQIQWSQPNLTFGYVPQQTSSHTAFPGTVKEIILSGQASGWNWLRAPTQTKNLPDILKLCGLENLENRLLNQLSGGQRQKVLIARSLIHTPDILILDEPTTAIDSKSQDDFYQFLRHLHQQLKLTILFVSHDLETISSEASRIVFVNRTLNCYHSPEEFLDPHNLQALYDFQTHIIHHHHEEIKK